MKGFGHWVVKYRHAILVVSLLLLIPAYLGMVHTRVNYDMLDYLPDSMETVKGQNLLMNKFGKGAFSIMVVENMKTDDVKKLKGEIEDVDNVDSVLNLAEVIDPNVPISAYPSVVKNSIKKQGATMLVVFYNTGTSDEGTLKAVSKIRKISTKDCYLSGMSALVVDLRNLCEREEAKYVGLAVLFCLAATMLLLDSFVAPFLFLLSIGMAILYNLGTNIFFGEISYVTKAIAAVLQLAVTMDYSIFLWHSFLEKLDTGLETPEEAMAEAVNATLTSVTGSSVTTIAGFLALCAMSYTMGRDLGLVMAKGVLFGVIVSVTVLPAILLLLLKVLRKTRHRSFIPDMNRLSHALTSRYGVYILIFCILVVPAGIGYAHRNITYDFTKIVASGSKELPEEDTKFMTANQKLNEDFGIATTHLVIADAGLSSRDGRAMCDQIKDLDGVRNVVGIDSMLGSAVPKSILPDELTGSFIAGGKQLIMVNSEYNVSTAKCNRQINQINAILHQYDKSAKLIGEGPATKDLIELTSKDFRVVNIISIAAVFFIIYFVLKSWSLPFLLVAVIEFAIYVNLGITGYTGTEMAFLIPVLISTIQLGSTVDYAILMSTRYTQERKRGQSKRDAVITASRTCTPSIIVSAVGFFAATFGVAVYSNVGIISMICSLMARGAIISMATVILILPSFFMALDPLICRTTRGMKHLYRNESQGKTETDGEGNKVLEAEK